MKLSPKFQSEFPYAWLWASPILTIPTLFLISLFTSIAFENQNDVQVVLSVLGPATWHLVLLIPALFGKSEFIRWHGRQALLIAGIRTTVAMLSFVFISYFWLGSAVLVGIWLGGNLWGMSQVRRGDCALMRWTGHSTNLPLRPSERL